MKINKQKYNTLTDKEKYYADIMLAGNTLYLQGKPGSAKSAIMKDMKRNSRCITWYFK